MFSCTVRRRGKQQLFNREKVVPAREGRNSVHTGNREDRKQLIHEQKHPDCLTKEKYRHLTSVFAPNGSEKKLPKSAV